MTGIDVLLDLFRTQKAEINALVDGMPPECLLWQPDDEANNINITIWHVARSGDIVANVIMADRDLDNQIWHRSGWTAKTGYNPDGIAYKGWGALTGYTREQVEAVPLLPAGELLHYFNEVYDALVDRLTHTRPEALTETSPGQGHPETNYGWYSLILADSLRHTGEILAIKAMWERKQSGSRG